jgi:hypothetical protein
VSGERRRHADQDRVGAPKLGKIGIWHETAARDRLAKALGGNVVDVGAALPERRDLAGIDFYSDHREAVVEQRLHQRQADKAEPRR